MIPHNKPSVSGKELFMMARSIRKKRLIGGRSVAEFEQKLANLLETDPKHVVASNSGSSALYIALNVIDPSRVSIPIYTCAAVSQAAQLAGAEVAFEDNENECSFHSKKQNEAVNTVRVLVHTFGVPHNDLEVASDVIEDCSQALGARVHDRHVGLFGQAGTFSFSATKIVSTAGAGGATVFRNAEMAEYARNIIDYDNPSISRQRFNFQLTDVAAECGIVQLGRIKKLISKREELFNTYNDMQIPLIANDLPKEITPVRYRAIVRVEDPDFVITRLAEHGIRSIIPIHEFEFVSDPKLFPNASSFSKKHVSLPLYPSLSFTDAKKIGKLIKSLI